MNDESYQILRAIRRLACVELCSNNKSKIKQLDEVIALIMEMKNKLLQLP